MSETATRSYADFTLPLSVVTKVEVSRLVQELEALDMQLTTDAVRTRVGTAQRAKPVLSRMLEEFLVHNRLTMSTSQERSNLIAQMHQLKDTLPVIHMTFAVEADAQSLQQIVQWLRSSVHPQAVLAVGIQPGLVAGVYMRTPNKVHDLSMRAALKKGRSIIAKELEALSGAR